MDIRPIALTSVDWKSFIEETQELLGYSPTRGLDECTINIADAQSFLSCLNLENKPKQALMDGGQHFKHVHVTFMGGIDSDLLVEILSKTSLSILTRERKKDYVCIITGSVQDYHDAILMSGSDGYLDFTTSVLLHLEKGGFKDVFQKYNRTRKPHGIKLG